MVAEEDRFLDPAGKAVVTVVDCRGDNRDLLGPHRDRHACRGRDLCAGVARDAPSPRSTRRSRSVPSRRSSAGKAIVLADEARRRRRSPALRRAVAGAATCWIRPLVKHGDAVRHRQRLGLVVRDVDDGDAEPVVQVPQSRAASARAAACRARRAARPSAPAGARTPARAPARPAAAGRRRAAPAGVAPRPSSRTMSSARCTRVSISAARDAAHRQRKGDVLGHGHVREQRVVLEHHADVRACAAAASSIGCPRSRISPAVGRSKPASIISVVVLPEPEGPSSVRNSPFRDVEIEVIDDVGLSVVGLADVVEGGEHGVGASGRRIVVNPPPRALSVRAPTSDRSRFRARARAPVRAPGQP